MNKKSGQKKTSSTKKQAKKAPVSNKKSTKQKKNILPYVNRFMPYVLSVMFVVLMFSALGFAGKFGAGLSGFFRGLFSEFALHCIWIFMLYHALMWYHDVNRKICTRRIICSFATVSLVATLQYLIQTRKNSELLTKSITTLFAEGKNGQGGGVIGGFLGNLLLNLSAFLAFAIVIIALIFLLLQMANKTPAYLVRYIIQQKKKAKNAPEDGKKHSIFSKKHKNFDVYDDEDDISEDNLEKLEFSDTNIPIPTEDRETEEEVFEVETTTYDGIKRTAFNESSMKDSPQIKPFDKNAYEKMQNTDETYVSKYNDSSKKDDIEDDKYSTNDDIYSEDDKYSANDDIYSDDEKYSKYDEDDDFIKNLEPKKAENEYTFNINSGSSAYPDWEFDDEEEKLEETEDEEIEDEDIEEIDENNISDYLDDVIEKPIAQNNFEKKPIAAKDDFEVEKKPMFAETEPPAKKEKPSFKNYLFPSLDFLNPGKADSNSEQVNEELQENARIIVETLNNFNVRTRIVDVRRGPTVTRYELMPEPGVRVSKIASLIDDIALNLAAEGIRIECPIPGKSAVGIEVPNRITSFVYLRPLLEDPKFKGAKSSLTCALGKNISGENVYLDIEKMPHLLVAGATGMGKSVCINSLLVSLLYKSSPEDVRLILVDPKRVELSNYNGIPHLLVPTVCEPKKSLGTLQWAVTEMEKRFEMIENARVRNIIEYNERIENGMYEGEKMARIVIVIDELADLKMAVPEIEDHIMRLTQKARAAGIHLIIGTQRPSVDVITGVIKANIPSRIAFRVSSNVDSRTILDEAGAEKLVSKGDMLFKPVGSLNMIRVQGAFITADEIEDVIAFLKQNASENYDEEVMQMIDSNAQKLSKNDRKDFDGEESDGAGDDLDPKFYDALELAVSMGKISSSLLQRKLGLGFQRAARIIDQMEECRYVGESNGSKPRDVLISKEEFFEIRMRNENLD